MQFRTQEMYKFEWTIIAQIWSVYQPKNSQLVNYVNKFLVSYFPLSLNKIYVKGSFQASGLQFSWYHLHELDFSLLLWMPTNFISDTERWISVV